MARLSGIRCHHTASGRSGRNRGRAQGMRRYYALLADRDQTIRLIRMRDTETILAEKAYPGLSARRYR